MSSSHASSSKTTFNLATSSNGGKRVQTTDDILRAIESTMPSTAAAQSARNADANFSARIQGRINEHEIAFGDMSLPRQRLPKVDNALLDRYHAARQNVLVLGATQQMAAAAAAGSKPGTHRSGRGAVRGSNSQGRLTAAAALANAHAGTVAPVAAAARGSGTSRRGSREASEYDDGDDDEQGSDGDGGPGLHRLGLSSAWSSFKSSAKRGGGHHAGAQDGGPDVLSREPSGGLDAEVSYVATTHSRASRHYNRQASNNSMASRASLSASACGSYASGSAVSSSRTGRLGRESSYVSSSSGHTLRSHRAGSVTGGSTRRKGGKKKKPPKPKPGRVTLAFAEFGAREDWVSQTLLKHALASIIQARWRGYHTRQHWKADKQQLVEDEQARLCAAETQAARLQDMQHKLALYQQKKLAQAAEAAAADAAAEDGGSPEAAAVAAAAASHWPAPSSAASRATSAARRRGEGGPGAYSTWQSGKSEASFHPGGGADGCCDSDSDSGWSDVELEDVAAIKFRAVTPPWQRVAEHQQMSQQLRQRTAAAAAAALGEPLDAAENWGADPLGGMLSLWSSSSSENTAKLGELRRRRISRKPEPVPLSAPAAAAAAAAGLLAAGAYAADEASAPAGGDGADADAAESADADGSGNSSAPLSADAVEQLLLERYYIKFSRLGVPRKMPGLQRWRLLQQAQAAAAQAADDAAAAGVASGFDATPAAGVQGFC